jgi:hypothetical protein
MLKEREEQIREDYDKVLASKLAGEISPLNISMGKCTVAAVAINLLAKSLGISSFSYGCSMLN